MLLASVVAVVSRPKCFSRAKGLRKNNLAFWHLVFTPSSAAPQSRNSQRRPGYACGFAQSFAAKSDANPSANSTKLFLRRP